MVRQIPVNNQRHQLSLWQRLSSKILSRKNKHSSREFVWRSFVLQALVCSAIAWGVGNAAYLQLNPSKNQKLQQYGDNRYLGQEVIQAHRGQIVDRKEQALASNVSKAAVSIVGSQLNITQDQKILLAQWVGMSIEELNSKIEQAKSGLIYLRRFIDLDVGRQIKQALKTEKISGVYITEELYRYYPHGEAASQLIGTVNLSGQALDGLEASMNEQLEGVDGVRRFIKTGVGNAVESLDNADPPIHGTDLRLTIDKDLQYSVYNELRSAVLSNEAKAGSAVMLNANTGEVLALANYPSFDPNKAGGKSIEKMRNRAATDAFEPGSIMKPFSMSLALQKGVVTPQSTFSGDAFLIGKLRVNDGEHAHKSMSLAEVMQYSSNVGTVKMIRSISNAEFHAWLSAVGFGQPLRLPLGSSTLGRLRAPERWQEVEKATISYGYGLSASLLQLARAYTVFTNNGELLPLSLVYNTASISGTMVMKPEIAALLRDYMERVTQKGGTAPCAAVENFRVAGKTGTARKFDGRKYLEKYVASFVGFAPVTNPRVIVAVMIDEPGIKGKYYGGAVAAPVFSNIVANTMRILNVAPDGGAKPACSAPLEEAM